MDVQWTIHVWLRFNTKHTRFIDTGTNRSAQNCLHYWPVITLIKKSVVTPRSSTLALVGSSAVRWTLLLVQASERNTKTSFSRPSERRATITQQDHFFAVLISDPDQMKWRDGKKKNWKNLLVSNKEKEMFKTLIHLGFRTTVSNYSHGNLVKAMVFQGWRETTFCYNYARSTWIIFPVCFGSH